MSDTAPALPISDFDLSQAVVLSSGEHPRVENAVRMLVEEVQKRTQIRWEARSSGSSEGRPVILVGLEEEAAFPAEKTDREPLTDRSAIPPEGFRIVTKVEDGIPAIFILGSDDRGVLYGVGRFLRTMRMGRRSITLPAPMNLQSSPHYPLRGHQLGYRPKTNSYDGWDLPQWEQYIRDLAVFGANAVELIPPRSDDDAYSPHFPLPPMEMMIGMSQLLDDYGLDCWIWYPAMDAGYSDPDIVEAALNEWGEVFRQLPRVDAVFVPGGDPGHTEPRILMALLERQAVNLRQYHPEAQMWVSPQGFNRTWIEEFVEILNKTRPEWLTGIVYGPQVRGSLAELRAAVPSHYPIRNYPDITHTRQCQYPVPGWDPAFAFTEGREPINPRPEDQARYFGLMANDAVGFITYSEGCNDDVNKAVWSALGWDPNADLHEILRDYSRYYISDPMADDFAQGLLALERNWRGPLLANEGVALTLQQFQAMEKRATPQVRQNWRFQQALYRAYYDAYLRRRLLYETELEERAMERLRQAPYIGLELALAGAEETLDRAVTHRVDVDGRARLFELAEALFQSIRMQLSVERYAAIAVERGANLDSVDVPLNNRLWLKDRFEALRALEPEEERLKAIDEMVNWTNPGPGGFYDDLGHPARQPHLIQWTFEDDPDRLKSERSGFTMPRRGRVSWGSHAESLYDSPLKMTYSGLDPEAAYTLRVVYAGDNPKAKIRLIANNDLEIHSLIEKERPIRPVEFDLPPEATARGTLTLRWEPEPGRGGNGRGCQVSEVWLMKRAS